MRRVVVTGLGLVTPLACGVEESWAALLAGKSGASAITRFRTDDLATKIACQVPRGDGTDGTFNPDQWVDPKEQRRMDDFIIYGLAAAKQAVLDSGWVPQSDEDRCRTGVMTGSGIGGLPGIEEGSLLIETKGPRRLSPFFIPGRLINLISGYISIEHGYKGPNSAVVTACATGAHAIGDAARMIALDDADVMVAGGAENAICRIGIAGFNACRALSTAYNDTPEKASRPYDRDRDGFVMGEGAGMVVLEEYEHAKRARREDLWRDQRLWPVGRRLSYHAPRRKTAMAVSAPCRWRLKRAGISPGDIDYVNATWHLDHGRRHRTGRGRTLPGQCRRQNRHVLDQILHRASAGRGGLGGSDLLPAGDARRHRAAHHQPGRSGCHHRDRPCAATRLRSARSMSRCRTASASAAPMPALIMTRA